MTLINDTENKRIAKKTLKIVNNILEIETNYTYITKFK